MAASMTGAINEQTQTGYARVGDVRAKGSWGRIALAILISVPASLYSQTWWPAVWFGLMCLGQIADHQVFLWFRRNPAQEGSFFRRATCCVVVFLNTITYAGSAIIFWLFCGDLGRFSAVIQACAGLVYVSLHMYHQRSLLVSAFLAHATYLLGLPSLTAVGHQPASKIFFMFNGLIYLAYVANVVRQFNHNNDQLGAAKIVAQRASDAKSDFLATISHEIRTPLHAVVSAIHLLQRTPLTPQQLSHIQMMASASDLLMGLLSDVLDLSRIEAGKVALDPTDTVLRNALETLVSLWQPQASEKGYGVTLHIALDVPEIIHVDTLRLRQILFNLLSNAVKFTDSGAITVNVSCGTPGDGSQAGTIYFDVIDTGCGISHEALARLFSNFEQADAGTTRRFGGSGLGLSISRGLAEIMGGALTVKSHLGEGSTFRLALCLRPGRSIASLGEGQPGHDRRVPELVDNFDVPNPLIKVLIAEDHAVNRYIMEQLLAPLGWGLTMVNNGVEAVAVAASFPFDVIILDMQMPLMDGLTAAQTIRSGNGPNCATPIMAITANALEQNRRNWAAANVEAYITKPLDARLLLTSLLAMATGKALPLAACQHLVPNKLDEGPRARKGKA